MDMMCDPSTVLPAQQNETNIKEELISLSSACGTEGTRKENGGDPLSGDVESQNEPYSEIYIKQERTDLEDEDVDVASVGQPSEMAFSTVKTENMIQNPPLSSKCASNSSHWSNNCCDISLHPAQKQSLSYEAFREDELMEDITSDLSDLEDNVEQSEHDTESEQSAADEGVEDDGDSDGGTRFFFGKGPNPFQWSSQCQNTKTPRNLVTIHPDVRGEVMNLDNNSEEQYFWACIFTPDMLNEIIVHTNQKIRSVRHRWSANQKHLVKDVDMIELKACLGLCYLYGALRARHEALSSLFASDGTGRDIFRATMTLKRFLFLLSVLCFDDVFDREERKRTDPLAAISFLFSALVKNSQACFTVGNVCVDQILVGFRGNCGFRVYKASRSNKCGIKVMTLADAKTGYFYNGYISLGKDDGIGLPAEMKEYSKTTQAVLRLAEPIFDSDRNVTADNCFTSVELVQVLKIKGLTYVGTLKESKREIPRRFQAKTTRPVGSSIYGYTKDLTLLSHVPKRNKCIILVSSLHHNAEIDQASGKPEILEFYDSSKGAMDNLEQKCAEVSVARSTRRWTMALFYTMLDIAAINSNILHCFRNTENIGKRFVFTKNLGLQLVKPNILQRVYNDHLPLELQLTMSRIAGVQLPPEAAAIQSYQQRGNGATFAPPRWTGRQGSRASCASDQYVGPAL